MQIMNKTFKSFLEDKIKRPLLILPGCLDSEVEFLQYFDHYYDDFEITSSQEYSSSSE